MMMQSSAPVGISALYANLLEAAQAPDAIVITALYLELQRHKSTFSRLLDVPPADAQARKELQGGKSHNLAYV